MAIKGKAILHGKKGGSGSGNFGHRGRPGKLGGSVVKGGSGAAVMPGDLPSGMGAQGAAKRGEINPPIPSTTRPVPAKLDDVSAKNYMTQAATTMEEAGLHPYLSEWYSDSQIGGMNTSSTNITNWTIQDGDRKSNMAIDAKPGTVEMGVAVWGEKLKLPYRDQGERFIVDKTAASGVGNRIAAALKKAGYPVQSVRFNGGDEGFGTKNVNFAVVLKK